MTSTGTETPLSAALEYASLGWRVVPLHYPTVHANGSATCSCNRPDCGSQGKHPVLREWQLNASTDHNVIRSWWGQSPGRNVGIALGGSSNLVAIDIDCDEAEQLLLQMSGGNIPDTCEISTSSDRRRLLFTIPDSLEADPKTKIFAIGPKKELRFQSTGGQCVMPPSLHPSGCRYHWVEGRSHRDLEPAYMPDWLLVEMTRPEPTSPAAIPQIDYTESQPDVFTPAIEFNQRVDWWRDILSPAGFKEAGRNGDTRYFTRPGKSGGVSATLGHYKGKDGTPVLYVFTSSIPELPGNKTYDAFGAYARLFHRGDFAAAGRDLASKGFGNLKPKNRLVPHIGAESTGPVSDLPTEVVGPPVWPDPVPLRTEQEPIPFPLDVFPTYLQDFVGSVAHVLGVPNGYVAANVLGVASGAIGATINVQLTPTWKERACLFVAVVAPKSAGKTPAHNAAMKAIQRVQAERYQTEKRIYFTTDTTIEALGPLLVARPRGILVACDELSGFILGMNQYKPSGKGSDRAYWLSAWAGTALSICRRNPEAPHIYVPEPSISVLGGVQPAVLDAVFSLDDGLAERFLFEASEPLPPRRPVRDPYLNADLWLDLVKRLAKLELIEGEYGPIPHTIGITDEAWRVFSDWCFESSVDLADRDVSLDGFRNKGKGHAARIALVLHLLGHYRAGEDIPILNETTMANGVRLMRYYMSQVARVRSGANAPRSPAETVLNWIRKCGRSSITRRDVFRGLRKTITESEQLREPLKKLVEHGYLAYADPIPGKKTEAVYVVRPDLAEVLDRGKQ